jgi:cobalt-zinc-cadmium efflux system membrane fusion protein
MCLKNKIKLFIGLSTLWVILFLFASCKGKTVDKDEDSASQLSDTLLKNMTIGIAHTTQVRSELRLTGKITADQSKQIDVFALVTGTVKEVNVELGDYVQKDQVLAVIHSGDVADYERQFVEASSTYAEAKKAKEIAEDMYASKLISSGDYLQAQQEYNKADAALTKAKEMKKIYSISNTSDYVVKAPISGFVIDKKINKEMQIRPDDGDNIFTIAQLTDVWMMANVYEKDIYKVKEKDTVLVNVVAYPDKNYKATIDKVYNILDPQSRVMKVRVKLNNPDYLLKPDMYGNIIVSYTEPVKMLTIASSALVFDNSNNYVVIHNGNKDFTVQRVDVYAVVGNKTYIQQGLKENDKVVTSNQLMIFNAISKE